MQTMSKELKEIILSEFELFKRPSDLTDLPTPGVKETFEEGFKRGMRYSKDSVKLKRLEHLLERIKAESARFKEQMYYSEFTIVDGVRQHKDGLSFGQWCSRLDRQVGND